MGLNVERPYEHILYPGSETPMPSVELASRYSDLRNLARIWEWVRRLARIIGVLIVNGPKNKWGNMSSSRCCARNRIIVCAQARGSSVTVVTECAQVWPKSHVPGAEPSQAHHREPVVDVSQWLGELGEFEELLGVWFMLEGNDPDHFVEFILARWMASPSGCVIDVTDIQGMEIDTVPSCQTFERSAIPTRSPYPWSALSFRLSQVGILTFISGSVLTLEVDFKNV